MGSKMSRFVIDPGVGLHLVAERLAVHPDHELLAPTQFRSQTLSIAHEATMRGELTEAEALDRLERLWKLKIRLLGDAVLRRTAWSIATESQLPQTYDAEYFALTRLQADAFVTMDPVLASFASGIVPVASVDDLI
jgi:predicted nucleic acid-binding protein